MATSVTLLSRHFNALSISTRKQLLPNAIRLTNTNTNTSTKKRQWMSKQRLISSFSCIHPTTTIASTSSTSLTRMPNRCIATRTIPTYDANTTTTTTTTTTPTVDVILNTNDEPIQTFPTTTTTSIQELFEQLPPPLRRTSRTKLKPHITRKRIARLKTYTGNKKEIRHSPWRLNLICQLITNLPVKDALMQLQFCQKMKAPLIATLVERTARRAYHQDYLQMSQLEVAECFATHGKHLKRVKIMGRGRSGIKRRRFSHVRLVLREIDFDLKIRESYTKREKMDWFVKKLNAEKEHLEANKEREELEMLEREAKAKQEKNKE